MDGHPRSITPLQLRGQLGTARAPIVLDMRQSAGIGPEDRTIVSGRRRDPKDVARWADDLAPGASVVVCCARGGHISQGVAAVLRERGLDARFLEGRLAAGARAACRPAASLHPRPASGSRASARRLTASPAPG